MGEWQHIRWLANHDATDTQRKQKIETELAQLYAKRTSKDLRKEVISRKSGNRKPETVKKTGNDSSTTDNEPRGIDVADNHPQDELQQKTEPEGCFANIKS